MGAAAEQFLSDGYLGTSIDKVAVRAGVARQTVYEHFGGKEQLFTEVMHQTIDEVGRAFSTASRASRRPATSRRPSWRSRAR